MPYAPPRAHTASCSCPSHLLPKRTMDHEETHPTEPHAPSYAAVADPSVSTDVHHEEPQEPQPAQEHHSKPAHHGKHRHRGKKRERPPSPTPAPPAKRAPGTPSYAHVADPEVSTQVGETAEDGESLLNALGASSMELQRILAGDDKVPGGYVLNPEGAGDDVQDGQVQAAAEEEHEPHRADQRGGGDDLPADAARPLARKVGPVQEPQRAERGQVEQAGRHGAQEGTDRAAEAL
ncbi:hypothetical protein CALCODRAFT_19593 [Calocera cornea HHB12733]|uniref:Uncharacterized protein n=1 Tax=Calocera cornea HHB12733 TaxID=1353952 RepID=A0A165E6F6_9BASI|nr:hypothetical protein CALCODRAFT_19593 [Calocera cornea HHB12733]